MGKKVGKNQLDEKVCLRLCGWELHLGAVAAHLYYKRTVPGSSSGGRWCGMTFFQLVFQVVASVVQGV